MAKGNICMNVGNTSVGDLHISKDRIIGVVDSQSAAYNHGQYTKLYLYENLLSSVKRNLKISSYIWTL